MIAPSFHSQKGDQKMARSSVNASNAAQNHAFALIRPPIGVCRRETKQGVMV